MHISLSAFSLLLFHYILLCSATSTSFLCSKNKNPCRVTNNFIGYHVSKRRPFPSPLCVAIVLRDLFCVYLCGCEWVPSYRRYDSMIQLKNEKWDQQRLSVMWDFIICLEVYLFSIDCQSVWKKRKIICKWDFSLCTNWRAMLADFLELRN